MPQPPLLHKEGNAPALNSPVIRSHVLRPAFRFRESLMKKALLILLLAVSAFAQTSNATLGGTVSDASGALIPGITITATNTGTGIVNTVVTNDAGAYQFASLQPGTYTVTAELPGFQTQTRNGVALGVSQQVRL